MKVLHVVKTRRFKVGYELRTEIVEVEDGHRILMKSAYNPAGDYIGNNKDAWYLCKKQRISPEIIPPKRVDHQACQIGFSKKQNKWFGWSHRAIYGFTVGDVVKEGDCTASSGWTEEYLKDHPGEDDSLPIGFTAKTLEDAKLMAIAFARSVS